MLRILPRHHSFSDCMSEEITLLKFCKTSVTIQARYNPHILEINVWKKLDSDGLFVLKKWKHIPLDKKARVVCKCTKYENKFVKYREKLDEVYKTETKK